MSGPAARESGATCRCDHQLGLGAVRDRPVDRVLEAGSEDGDEDDERQADHEGRRGDRRARRVARRVVAGELAGRVPQALQGPADDRGQRAHDVARAQRDADEDQQRAEPHGADRLLAGPPPNSPGRAARARRGPPAPVTTAPAAARRRFVQRLVAHRGHGRHPRGAHGGEDGGRERDADADCQADDDRPRRELHAATRDAQAGCVEERAEPLREAQAAEQAKDGRGDADQQSLGRDRHEDLTPRGPDGAQQRELAPALGHGDREGVEDDEGAHEQRRAGEGQQGRREEAAEASLACLASSAAVCSPVLISMLRGSAWRRRATSSAGATPCAADATTRETLPSRPYQAWMSAIGATMSVAPPIEATLP